MPAISASSLRRSAPPRKLRAHPKSRKRQAFERRDFAAKAKAPWRLFHHLNRHRLGAVAANSVAFDHSNRFKRTSAAQPVGSAVNFNRTKGLALRQTRNPPDAFGPDVDVALDTQLTKSQAWTGVDFDCDV